MAGQTTTDQGSEPEKLRTPRERERAEALHCFFSGMMAIDPEMSVSEMHRRSRKVLRGARYRMTRRHLSNLFRAWTSEQSPTALIRKPHRGGRKTARSTVKAVVKIVRRAINERRHLGAVLRAMKKNGEAGALHRATVLTICPLDAELRRLAFLEHRRRETEQAIAEIEAECLAWIETVEKEP